MTEDIKSPQFPESIFEGTLSSWLKKEGEEIKQDEVVNQKIELLQKEIDNLQEQVKSLENKVYKR